VERDPLVWGVESSFLDSTTKGTLLCQVRKQPFCGHEATFFTVVNKPLHERTCYPSVLGPQHGGKCYFHQGTKKTPRIGWNSQFILMLVHFGQFCWCQYTLVGTRFSTTFVCCSAPWVRSLQYLALSSVLDGNADICDQKCIGSCHNAASILWALAQIFGYIWGVVRPWNGYLGLQMESIKDRFCSIFLSPNYYITILRYVTILQIMVQVTCACVVKHKSLLVSRGNATHCHQNDNVRQCSVFPYHHRLFSFTELQQC